MRTADEIVKALAERSPITQLYTLDDFESICYYCKGYQYIEEPKHDPDCLWLDIVENAADIKMKEECRRKIEMILSGKPLEELIKEFELERK